MPKRVLIVDDAALMRGMLRDIFASAGYDVVGEAADGTEAVDACRRLNPDLVTMDIVMPFKSGIEATREIVAEGPAKVVMCSALGQEHLVMQAIEAGVVDGHPEDWPTVTAGYGMVAWYRGGECFGSAPILCGGPSLWPGGGAAR